MSEPQTVPELIDAFGGPTAFSVVIGKNPSTASEMKRSGSIKPGYWPKIVEAAASRGIRGVTYEHLTMMHVDEEATS
jgi:hypothetical protein